MAASNNRTGQNKANPTALLLSSIMMLRHMGFYTHASRVETAVLKTIREGKHTTRDLGGTGSTTGFTNAIIDVLQGRT